jgi:alpha-1,6-mannosyltransferase
LKEKSFDFPFNPRSANLQPADPASSSSSGPIRAVSAAGAVSVAAYLLLAWASHALPRLHLTLFFAVFAVVTAAAFWAYWRTSRSEDSPLIVRWILIWAVLFRLIGFWASPIYEDDFYRYLWDGRTLATGHNPYLHPPSDAFGDEHLPAQFQDILDKVNFPDVPTIYGPVCQAVFAVAYWIAPGELWSLKLLFLLADLATMILLFRLLRRKSQLLIYAWSPLLIQEIAFSAHSDILAVCLLVWAMERLAARRPVFACALLALAAGAKVIVLPFLPFLLLGSSNRIKLRAGVVFAATLVLLHVPFVMGGGFGEQGLGVFLQRWEFNSFAFAIFAWMWGDEAGRMVSLILFAASLIWLLRIHRKAPVGTIPRGDILLAAFFLLSPVANPWYFVALLPFVTLWPSGWSLTLLSTVVLSYITGLNLGSQTLALFNHPDWVRPLEILPVMMVLVWENRGKFKRTESH